MFLPIALFVLAGVQVLGIGAQLAKSENKKVNAGGCIAFLVNLFSVAIEIAAGVALL